MEWTRGKSLEYRLPQLKIIREEPTPERSLNQNRGRDRGKLMKQVN